MTTRASALIAAAVLFATAGVQAAEPASAQRNLEELRNTVINLLQGLVDRGVLTREQAGQMVREAQDKAAADAATVAAQEKAEQDAVRVPYVPEIVKQEIRKQVAADLTREVTTSMEETARAEGWGTSATWPDWVKRMTWSSDIRLRGQADIFPDSNVSGAYVDFQKVNESGGIGKAGLNAFINTTEERERMRLRMRLGFESVLGWGWSMGARVTTGNLKDPVSTNQTLGNSGARYQTGFDLAWLQWSGSTRTSRQSLTATGGRLRNPFVTATDLVFDQDLTFEGVATNYRLGLRRDDPASHFAYLTLGAFPLQEVEIARDKWLLGGQTGIEWKFEGGSRLRFGGAYYRFENVSGRRNTLDSQLADYTAPAWLQRGNTLFDIRFDNDNNTNLFALAADYALANAGASFDWRLSPGYRITLAGDYVRNVGYSESRMRARAGFSVPPRVNGYQGEVAFGSAVMSEAHAWRVALGYRYVERDAVLDGFTDSDFHLGGTDAKGYTVGIDYSLTPRVMTRLRYLSANEIDGPPLGIDTVQLDFTASF